MNRERLTELMTGLLDDELSVEEKSELERELDSSEEARTLLETYRVHSRQLRALEPLQVSSELREKTRRQIESTPLSLRPSTTQNLLWLIGTVAACFLFFWASSVTRDPRPVDKLYLAQEGLVYQARAHTFQFNLTSGVADTHALHSQVLQGVLTQGRAQAVLECDAGQVAGQSLKLKLSLDLDGDEKFDLIQESETVVLDQEVGYEVVTYEFPPLSEDYSGKEFRGKAKLELLGESLRDGGLAVQFHPERAHLTLPLVAAHTL